ncbi:MAG: divergent polysaccharide deacetylase family protein [Alphaproteobacteria bacterium]|nr:MAG: divergent polysaccharide deacetylase family protein [Alphaproteobacteria bacterium]
MAGLLGLCVAVLTGWILFVDEPFGGEPMAVVSAATAAQPAGAQGTAAKPTAAAPVALADGNKPAANTVTIIDGTTGKRQEVTVGQPGALPQKKTELKTEPPPGPQPEVPVDQRLLESSAHGAIPKIAPDGARPSDIYARPVKPQRADAPRIAIVIEGLGIGANSTAEALAKLPAPVTLAFAPYGTDLERWVARARRENHEVLLQIGMEPFDYPDNDPGPKTLLASLDAEQNIDRLHWFLSRFAGYVGVTSLMGARFTAADQALGPVIREIGKRGLIWFDDGASPRSVASQMSGAGNVAFARADTVLDAIPTAAEIDNALARLEAAARSRGVAIGAASALPVSIERIAQWAKAAEGRGIVLVPVSMVANRPKTGS